MEPVGEVLEPVGPLWTHGYPKWPTGPPKRPKGLKDSHHLEAILDPICVNFSFPVLTIFWMPLRRLKNLQMDTKRMENGCQKDSKIVLLADLPNTSWICYLLHLSHIDRSQGAPGSHQKSCRIPEPLPNQMFSNCGRFVGPLWEPMWINVRSL